MKNLVFLDPFVSSIWEWYFFSIQQVFFIPDFSLLTSHHIGCYESVLVFLDPPPSYQFYTWQTILFSILYYNLFCPSTAARTGKVAERRGQDRPRAAATCQLTMCKIYELYE